MNTSKTLTQLTRKKVPSKKVKGRPKPALKKLTYKK